MSRSLLLASAAAALTLGVPPILSAQADGAAARETIIVTPAWLAQHLHDPDLVVVHAGPPESYDQGHIPGAYPVALPSAGPQPDPSGMPTATALHDVIAASGVSDASRVVLYSPEHAAIGAPLFSFFFEYAGLHRVSVLDGGLPGWIAAGNAVSKERPLTKTSTLAPLTTRPIVADAEFVQAHVKKPGFVIVDARESRFYDDSHIPGAVNVPFNTIAKQDGTLASIADIQALFDKAGIKRGDTIVAYCHVGQQATAVMLAARATDHPALLYRGSFSDWSKRQLPVEKQEK